MNSPQPETKRLLIFSREDAIENEEEKKPPCSRERLFFSFSDPFRSYLSHRLPVLRLPPNTKKKEGKKEKGKTNSEITPTATEGLFFFQMISSAVYTLHRLSTDREERERSLLCTPSYPLSLSFSFSSVFFLIHRTIEREAPKLLLSVCLEILPRFVLLHRSLLLGPSLILKFFLSFSFTRNEKELERTLEASTSKIHHRFSLPPVSLPTVSREIQTSLSICTSISLFVDLSSYLSLLSLSVYFQPRIYLSMSL